jgi:DNA modification methylase
MEKITEEYAIYNNDCMELLPKLENESVDLTIYSPPFAGLYNYSSDHRDMSNNDNHEEFLKNYEFLVKETARVTKSGRMIAVHCQDLLVNVTKNHLHDLPSDIIKLHQEAGFHYVNRITIWKEPLKVRMRTMVRSLMHKLIVDDSTECFTAMPDYVLIFKKKGENDVPVEHKKGLKEYYGETPLLPAMQKTYGSWHDLNVKYKDWEDPKTNKLSHLIWQRYASSVWDDIRPDNVLKFKDAREDDDEKHVHPLQLDIIMRLVELYSNPGEVVLTPFMGVGSEVYGACYLNRKGIGVELKPSYFKQAIKNLSKVSEERKKNNQSLF